MLPEYAQWFQRGQRVWIMYCEVYAHLIKYGHPIGRFEYFELLIIWYILQYGHMIQPCSQYSCNS